MSAPVQPLRLPILLPAAAAWAVSGWATARSPGVCWALGTVTGALALAAAAALRRRRDRAPLGVIALVCGVACAAAVTSGAALYQRDHGPVRGWATERAVARVDAVVASDARRLDPSRAAGQRSPGQERWMVTVSAERVSARGRTWFGGVTLLVFTANRWRWTVGSRVSVLGRLSPLDGAGAATAGLLVSGPPQAARPPSGIWRIAARLREGLRRASSGHGSASVSASGLLPALVVGDTESLSPQVEQAMRASGLTHLTAVSGANLAILLGAVGSAAMALRVPRRPRLALGACCVVLFVVIARPEPSVVRAAAMGSVAILGLWAGRTLTGLHALTLAVVGLVLWSPWMSRSAGLALSVAATAGLLTLSRPISERLPASWPRAVRLAVAATGAAQCVTVPIVLLLNDGVSLVALPANLVAGPAAAVATISGSVALAVAPASDSLAHVAALPGLWASDLICRIAAIASGLPGATVPWPQGEAGALAAALCAAAVLVALAAVPRRPPRRPVRRRRPGSGRGRRLRAGHRPVVPLIAACLVGSVGLVMAGWIAAPYVPLIAGGETGSWPPGGWSAVQCDVGQGHATVLRTGPGSAVLVDAGPDPELVDRCLRRLVVTRLDLIVLTHFHGDHVLGLPGALRGRRATAALLSPLSAPADAAAAVNRWLAEAQVRALEGWAGTAGRVGGLRWTVLSPSTAVPDLDAGGPERSGPSDDDNSLINDASTVVLFQTATRAYVVLGDLEEAGQRGLLRSWPRSVPRVDVVTVAHHGSPHQDAALYRRIGASVALIGVGHNDYGHPSARTTGMLEAAGATVLRTDRAGDIAVVERPDGSLAVATRRGGSAPSASCGVRRGGHGCPALLAGLARAPRESIPLSLGAPAQARVQSRRRAGRAAAGARRPGGRERGPPG